MHPPSCLESFSKLIVDFIRGIHLHEQETITLAPDSQESLTVVPYSAIPIQDIKISPGSHIVGVLGMDDDDRDTYCREGIASTSYMYGITSSSPIPLKRTPASRLLRLLSDTLAENYSPIFQNL
jgi:hypothetical protein